MSLTELHMAVRTLPFLDAHANAVGSVLELRARPARRLLVWDPELVRDVFRADRRLGHPGSRSLAPLFGSSSLLWAEGNRHQTYRRLLGTALRGRGLLDYQEIVATTIGEALDELTPGSELALPDWTRRLTLRIVGRIILGPTGTELLDRFSGWMDNALGSRRRTLVHHYLRGGLPRSGDDLDRALVRAAKDNTATRPRTLASMLLAERIDDAELRDQIVSLLFAGHETTASAAAWTLYQLNRDGPLRRDVLDELSTAGDGSDPTRVPLLQAVLQEVLRLVPPVTVAENRTMPEDGFLGGRPLAAGTVLTPSIYLAHRRPDHFPQPRRFHPERFLDVKFPPHQYFPFGGGSRFCPGSQLAQLEVRMITAAALRRQEWRCVNPRAAVPQLRGHAMAPSPRLRMEVLKCHD
ncbi:cytochrome P450 [Amycolatopsis sp. H20-H5]|uniref:cytochrome P450 n=1 Tax=Amycolatopsis sp. H20-H5 TaxID=3046309 RepID=UPI002DBD30F7|nr:cytochrome P450 [Amycolatopsis sp. H20-H5]MEC3979204.1 cytochrome P450 [Amycolatopsis sp. H20-H5]